VRFPWHDAFQERIEERHGKCGIAMRGAKNHALPDQPVPQWRNLLNPALQQISDVARPMWPRTKLRHCPKVGKVPEFIKFIEVIFL
jgi:hypothetical protein